MMRIKKYLLTLTIGLPFFSLVTSCATSHVDKPIEVDFISNELYADDELLFTFKNIKDSDNISCTSEYDDQPEHAGYFSISPYDRELNEIRLTRKEVEIIEPIRCPLNFYNNNSLLQTVEITLPATEVINYSGYINDRTVSLMYQFQEGTKIYYSRGTGWIINKEPSTETNYRYWLATNFHVIASLPKTGTYAKLEYGSTTDSDGSTINLLSGYKNFNSFSIDKNLYSTTKTVTTSDDTPVTGNPGNDMVVIDVDFGNNPDTNVKLKLDKLNDEWDASGTEGQRHLNNFPDWNNYVISGAYHWGGYPVNNCAEEKLNTQQYAEWHTDEITNVKKNAGGEPAKDYWHPVKSTIYGTVVDVAPQIYSDTNKIDSKMGGGASGSMLIDRAKNVVGIYWGGWGVTGITFNPYFDIFNNSDFSYFNTADTFLSDYMFT